MWVDAHVHKVPTSRQLRNNEQWDDFHGAETLREPVDEQSGVENPIVDKSQADEFDCCTQPGDKNHLLAATVEVVVEVSIGTPPAALADVVFEGLRSYGLADSAWNEYGV